MVILILWLWMLLNVNYNTKIHHTDKFYCINSTPKPLYCCQVISQQFPKNDVWITVSLTSGFTVTQKFWRTNILIYLSCPLVWLMLVVWWSRGHWDTNKWWPVAAQDIWASQKLGRTASCPLTCYWGSLTAPTIRLHQQIFFNNIDCFVWLKIK